MSEGPLIAVENVSKRFCRGLKRSLRYGVFDVASEFAPWRTIEESKLRPEEFWATNNVSFELQRGECLGLIGRNGAGKTTLLRMLNGLIRPDKGRIVMRGRVGALIALGAGFNPILTGRENIYVNASILGLTKRETTTKIEEIIDFSEIRQFIDTPVQNYSSGMQVRLGFSIAVCLSPDILILDEVLAVGDRAFQIKCLTRVGEMMASAAVVFVSHQIELVSHIATKGLVLESGRTIFSGRVEEAIKIYSVSGAETAKDNWIRSLDGISDIAIRLFPKQIGYRGSCGLQIEFRSNKSYEDCVARVCFEDKNDRSVAEWNSSVHMLSFAIQCGTNRLSLPLENLALNSGQYRLNVNIQPRKSSIYIISANHCEILVADFDAIAPNAIQL